MDLQLKRGKIAYGYFSCFSCFCAFVEQREKKNSFHPESSVVLKDVDSPFKVSCIPPIEWLASYYICSKWRFQIQILLFYRFVFNLLCVIVAPFPPFFFLHICFYSKIRVIFSFWFMVSSVIICIIKAWRGFLRSTVKRLC